MYKKYLILIPLLALALRIAAIFLIPDYENPAAYEFGEIARNLASGRGYSGGAWFVNEAPTAFMAPVYPLIIAFFINTGFSYPYLLVQIFQSLVFALSLFFFFKLITLFLDQRIALLTIFFAAVYPLSVYYSRLILTSTLSFSLLVISLYCLYGTLVKDSLWLGIAAGISIAITLLLEPACSFAIAGAVLFLISRAIKHGHLAKLLKHIGVVIAVTIIGISPWTIRNYRVFKEVILLKSPVGLNLWQGNNPHATGSLFTEQGHTMTATLPESQLQQFQTMDEVSVDAWFLKQAQTFIIRNPGKALKLYFTKLINFYNPYPPAVFRYVGTGHYMGKAPVIRLFFYFILFITSIIGIVLGWRHRYDILPFLVPLIVAPFFFALFHLDNHRYRFPYEHLLLIFAAITVHVLYSTLWAKKPQTTQH